MEEIIHTLAHYQNKLAESVKYLKYAEQSKVSEK